MLIYFSEVHYILEISLGRNILKKKKVEWLKKFLKNQILYDKMT